MNASTFHLPFLALPTSPTLIRFHISLRSRGMHCVHRARVAVISLLILNKNVSKDNEVKNQLTQILLEQRKRETQITPYKSYL